jgi:hypothetical protein
MSQKQWRIRTEMKNLISSLPKTKKIIKMAKTNRNKFLDRYKKRFKKENDRNRARIIIKLIQLEPSHLTEPWILREVIEWLRNHKKNKNYLKAAFVKKGKRMRLTTNEQIKLRKDFLLAQRIDQMAANEKISKKSVFKEIALKIDADKMPEQAELSIKKDYFAFKEKMKNRDLPFPYYGCDIDVYEEDGQIKIEGELYMLRQ